MIDPDGWDTYWRFELHRRAADPLDFRRWKRDSQRALRSLYPREDVRLLDATAGLGDHTVNLAEEGFLVEACDRSEIAREATRRALQEAELAVEVFDAHWESLERPARYDLIFHDAIHWVYDADELRASLVGLRDALAPGGALVFFFADASQPDPGAGLENMDWDWPRMKEPRQAWSHRVGDTTVTLALTAERGSDFIDERHLYLVQRDGADDERAELTMRHVYRWDWHGLAPVLSEVGFVDLRTDHFPNVKGYDFAMSRAFKPDN